ncbi:MAG: DUF4931 domain-containing protein [candidate division WOR-3 bacterium]
MSEVRRDIVTDTWVIVDTAGVEIPKNHIVEIKRTEDECPFCEGKESLTPNEIFAVREKGESNKSGWKVRVIPNKAPILRIEGELIRSSVGVYDRVNGIGANEVIIETPRHIRNLFELTEDEIYLVLKTYIQRISDLHKDLRFRYVLIFKNHGRLAGASSINHLHSELIALPATPIRVKQKLKGAKDYYEYKERCIFCDIIQQEIDTGERLIFSDGHFVVIAPYASRFPFEVHLFPLRHSHDFTEMTREEEMALARALKDILRRLKEVLENPPYNYIIHTAPALHPRPGHPEYWGTIALDYHWHIEIVPRLTEVAGFEWGTGFYINPVAPEEATLLLRDAG